MNDGKNSTFGTARARENGVMDVLSDVLLGRVSFGDLSSKVDLRLVGYAAALVKTTVSDPTGVLSRLMTYCREKLHEMAGAAVSYVDQVQLSWRSPWHLDASKLRRELPLHLMRKSA
ncbi:hypothetical protein HOY34_21345 [Xinfangfangia sp. D13-10-4-6]|uniref:hypothetical protein n=1 Tax=Pseudogemmobacter hezensis TaxID=2737662 RepID=UPI0015526AB2|nr:hypothetical protein [Pseudogemmobacter hezensis]NPD17728.1 hypothetical protein [Pseudogemmobacter hezensis]